MEMKQIVVGLDGSPESTCALEWAADLAELTGAEITAVTVFDAGPYMSWGISPVYVPDFDELREGLTSDLAGWCEPLRTRGITHRAVVRDGSAALEILREADARKADLIVMGSRGRGGFRELMLGSVAHHVTVHSKHPVMVVPRAWAAARGKAPAAAAATA